MPAPARLPTVACRTSHGLGGEPGYSREERGSARVARRERALSRKEGKKRKTLRDAWCGALDVSARCHKANTETIHVQDFTRAPRRTPSSGECALTGPPGS